MRPAIISGLLYGLLSSHAYACHHFTTWNYPFPQNCGASGNYLRPTQPSRPVLHNVPTPVVDSVPDVKLEIPLPDMSAQWGGTMDTELDLQMQRQKALRSLEK